MAKSDIKAGGAYVELLLKKKKFLADLKGAGKHLLRMGKVAAVAGAAIGAAAVGGVAVGIRQYIRMGDEMDKMSKRTGVTVEALSELKHAAGQSGASAQDLEKGFAGLSRSLFDAKRGSKEANDSLAIMGLRLSELEGLNPDEQMSKVADGLQSISDESTRGAVAQRLFGRAGRQLLPMLRDGSKGMNALRQEARDMGITMSTDAAEGAAKLLDMFSIVGSQAKALLFEVGAAAAPFVEAVLPVVQRFAKGSIDAVRGAGDFISSNLGVVTQFVMSAWSTTYNFVAPIIGGLLLVVADTFNAMLGVITPILTWVQGFISTVWSNVTNSTGSAMAWMQNAIVGAFSRISFVLNNWQLMVDAAVVSAALSIVRFANQAKYYFGTVIPTWLAWFADNWWDIFVDVVSMTDTVTANIWKNLTNLWDGIIGLFSGDGFSFEWTPLTDGFRSAIKELPKIAEREMGPIESVLNDEMNALGEKLNKEWEFHGKEFTKRSEKFTPTDPFDANSKTGSGPKPTPDIKGVSADTAGTAKKIAGAFSLSALSAGSAGGDYQKKTHAELRMLRAQQERESRRLQIALKGGMA